MPLTPTRPAAILETILTGIAAFFLAGANGDATAARHAAMEMLAAYHPQTADELSLAATIISCGFRSRAVLVQAATADLPAALMLRLHASGASLAREAARAQRHLAQIQKERKHAKTQPEPAPEPKPEEPAPRPLDQVAAFARASGISQAQSYDDRQREIRIAASLERAEAKLAAANVTAAPAQGAPERAAPAA